MKINLVFGNCVLLVLWCVVLANSVLAQENPPSQKSSGLASEPRISTGKSTVKLLADNVSLEAFCYKPTNYKAKRLILVMHGVNRNADEYRDHSIGMADRFEALVVAPKFDKERFPSIKYNRGGILTEDKQASPPNEWTYRLIPAIVQQIRQREGQDDLHFWIIGHSAGGQFIVRMSAFLDTGAERMVAANPGSHLFPNKLLPFGYGFGDLPESLANEDRIRNYLAAPLTIFLGTADDHADEYFDDSPEAMQQGAGRYQRGVACYRIAKQLAEQNNWKFGWRIVEAPGVGHDHQAMFDHPQCQNALFGTIK